MDYRAAANHIHDKLNKLGLSHDPRHSIRVRESFGNFSTVHHYTNDWLEVAIDPYSKRALIVMWLLYGGKLIIDWRKLCERRSRKNS